MCSGCERVFLFNDTATTEIYTLSLHDALPIFDQHTHGLPSVVSGSEGVVVRDVPTAPKRRCPAELANSCSNAETRRDRKSTRLNSSHANISYAVFCLKKKTC